jgi:very-short-patch-repair endonuclease
MDRRRLMDLAEGQQGAFRLEQARPLGIDRRALDRWIGNGELELVTPRVARFVAAPATRAQRALVAVLDAGPGAALSHESACAFWELPGFPLEPWQVTRERNRKDPVPHLAEVHEPRLLLPDHVVNLEDVPVTSPARTLFDLANTGRVHPGRIERALDTMLARRLVGPTGLEHMLGELAAKGRQCIRLMRGLIEVRGEGYQPPASGLESRFRTLAERAGLLGFERQVWVGDDVEPIGRVDFIDVAARIVVEIDSDRFHNQLSDRRSDTARDDRLRAAGFEIVRITEWELWHQPWLLIARLRDALATQAAA